MATSGRGMLVSATLIVPLLVLGFSAGARGVLGSRFATVESVCILALLVW